MATKKVKKSEDITRFSKEQFLNSKRYIDYKDVLSAILDEGDLYSFDEVDRELKLFLESEGM